MKRTLSILAYLLVLLAGTFAFPTPSCTLWMKQTNGTYFRTCVDDKGTQYCEEKKSATGKPYKVSCK